MPIFSKTIPFSLYIHLPWCVKKCPYCDFNSHEKKAALPEEDYVSALLRQLDRHVGLAQARPITSIFFGGGTPSLFSGKSINRILEGIAKQLSLSTHAEITLEANPGTVEASRFQDFRAAGVNRLSLGVQSLDDAKLKRLGRIHDAREAMNAIHIAKKIFDQLNIDIMYGLPDQTIDEALSDIQLALDCFPVHFSWYQLTIEPNTLFYRYTPTLPLDDAIFDMQQEGQAFIKEKGFQQYEVSAYALSGHDCVHNRNYWEFGDYLGLGAGAHSKITDLASGHISRFSQLKHPKDYMHDPEKFSSHYELSSKDKVFEFMLNALRLTSGVPYSLFESRSGILLRDIQPILSTLKEKKLMLDDAAHLRLTEQGHRYLNDVVAFFL